MNGAQAVISTFNVLGSGLSEDGITQHAGMRDTLISALVALCAQARSGRPEDGPAFDLC